MRSTSTGTSLKKSGRPSVDDATLTIRINEQLARIPGWAWHPDGTPYAATEVAIFYGAIGPEPDRAVGVRVYGATDDVDQHLGWRRAQLRSRGSQYRPDGADEIAGHAFTTLQGLARVGGISSVRRESMTPLGADANGREERTDNYIIILDNMEVLS
jgi:hypothetical protein